MSPPRKSSLQARFAAPLFVLVLLCPACGGSQEPARTARGAGGETGGKVVLIGVDGADWNVIRPLMETGKLPNFRRIVQDGASGILHSMEPTLSPALWTTVATGREPAVHHIADFIVPLPGGGYKPVTSDMRAVPAFWNLIGGSGEEGKGKKVGVIGWLASWPAEPVHGYVVTSYLPYIYDWSTGRPLKGTVVEGIPRQTYPEALLGEIQPLKIGPEAVDPALVRRFFDPEKTTRLGKDASECVEGFLWSLASDETYRRIGARLYHDRPVDLFALYFGGIDVVSHRFWKFSWPQAEPYGADPAEVEALGGVIPAYYAYIDEILGEYLAAMDSRTTLIVLSDHGFKPVWVPAKPTTSGHHRLEGILGMYGRGVAKGAVIEGATLLDILPTVLALLDEPISRQLSGKVLGAAFELPSSGRLHLTYVDSYPPLPARDSTGAGEAIDANVLERLKSLGYIR